MTLLGACCGFGAEGELFVGLLFGTVALMSASWNGTKSIDPITARVVHCVCETVRDISNTKLSL